VLEALKAATLKGESYGASNGKTERDEKDNHVGDSDLGDCCGVSDVSARRIVGDDCETDDSESGGVIGVGGEELGLEVIADVQEYQNFIQLRSACERR
jgi:hypothetical protein